MRKFIARFTILLILLVNTLPVIVLAEDGKTPPPNKPYEKVVAKSGVWYAEQLTYDGSANLVIGYTGEHKSNEAVPVMERESSGAIPDMEFEIREKTVVRGIYLPFTYAASDPLTIQLKDSKGNVYKDLPTEKVITTTVQESRESTAFGEKIIYVFTPQNDIILPTGRYSMTLSSSDGAVGAFLIKGINASAYEKYKTDLQKWEVKTNPEKSKEDIVQQSIGNEALVKEDLEKYKYEEFETPSSKKPVVFLLDQEYLIDEIVLNTANSGNGALPGTISIQSENGNVIFEQQAYGGSLGDIANGIWKIAPNMVLPAGNYFIIMSDPEVLSYDKFGEPLFYVKASLPITIRYDFTGTYKINLDTYKARTLMGSVSDKTSSFSLKNFELTVLDKDGEIELIGKYDGLPFSQSCEIIEETENTIAAKFNFAADLSKLPYKARIGASAVVTLTKPETRKAEISIEGVATYKREATAKKGADDNAYSIFSTGVMIQKELPLFVMTALGKSGSAGSIPGPDNPVQAAAGILFPPLVGVIVNVLQELLKPKPEVQSKVVLRDKDWYKKQNPSLSEEQLAMAMLADAMGNTDNPDEGDAVSIGDNEKPGGSDYTEPEEYEPEQPYNEEPEQLEEYESEPSNEPEPYENPVSGVENAENQPVLEETTTEGEKPAPEIPAEPEEMILQTSANDATSRYVKGASTGEWINAETGGVLDYEKYKSTAAKQFAEDKKINDEQFDKNSKGETEHDKIVRDEMQKISDNEKWENYKNTKKSKYGTDDLGEIEGILEKHAEVEKASFETWQKIGNFNAVGEAGATVVGAVADTAVDGLSNVTPGGSYIKAGYKVTKGIAGTMAEKGVNTGSFVEGAIKGGTDAATDAVDKIGINNPYAKAAIKATATVTGETGGSAAGAYIRGGDENWKQAAAEGLVDGVLKAGVGAITDGIVGDAPDITIPKGSLNILPTMKNVIVNKPALTKIGSSLTDEFAVKPIVGQPIKDEIKKVFKK